MYNQRDEMYDVDDFDADIQSKQALIEEAKKIDLDGDPFEVARQVNDLKRKWKRINFWESDYEEQLSEEFDSILDVFYKKRNEGFSSNEEVKLNLIEQAKQFVASDNLNEATQGMNDLMSQWKLVASAGKEKDDELWEVFNELRQKFFERKQQHWDNLQTKFENARVVKQKLIEETEKLVGSTDWQATSKKFQELLNEWKSVGSAGKDHEDALWKAFNEKRQMFYDRREEFYALKQDEYANNFEQKNALLQEAKAIVEAQEFYKEATEKMKSLSVRWKEIGSCGKDKEDEIWKEFRLIMDSYFNGLREYNDQKHAQWRQRMQESRKYKLEMIAKQKQQIKYMQSEIVGLLGQRAIDEMNEDIKDKEDFILELEEQIADIDKTLNGQS